MSVAGTLSNETTTSATFTAPRRPVRRRSALPLRRPQLRTPPPRPARPRSRPSSTGDYQPHRCSTGGCCRYIVFGYARRHRRHFPVQNWALAGGSAPLPACLSLSSAGVLTSTGSQTVNGAPAAGCVGVYSGIIFTMTDSGTANGLTATSSAQTITVTGPTLTFPASLPNAAVGSAYSKAPQPRAPWARRPTVWPAVRCPPPGTWP